MFYTDEINNTLKKYFTNNRDLQLSELIYDFYQKALVGTINKKDFDKLFYEIYNEEVFKKNVEDMIEVLYKANDINQTKQLQMYKANGKNIDNVRGVVSTKYTKEVIKNVKILIQQLNFNSWRKINLMVLETEKFVVEASRDA